MLLDNNPANPCVGCGPQNPMGLRLAFERAEHGARTRLVVVPHMVGWPNRLHSGLLYLAMTETANWSVYAMLGRVGLPTRTGALAPKRFVRVGEALAIEGAWDANGRVVHVRATDEKGATVAELERAFDLPTRAEFRARMGEDALPAEFEELIPE